MKYLNYFFYIATNWDIRIAWYILINEIRGEKKYGINTTGKDDLQHVEEKGIDIEHATIYMPASYDLLEEIFTQLSSKKIKHLLDIGCGKGRALCVAAHYNITKLTGIDFSKELCIAAEKNLTQTKEKIPTIDWEILNNDAFYFDIPATVDCIFMFNPFDEVIMEGVVENIMISLGETPRKLYVVYVNPLNKEILLGNGFTEIYYTKKLKYLEVSILEFTPKNSISTK
ncbi:MAG: methyltransferase domain-containing protein [Chitinophagaceae bacterium]|nr:methyltransferase domain-containing protein [Chitinophagaceae bacterium]